MVFIKGHTGLPPNYKHSEKTKRKISIANKGRKRTPEQIQRIKNSIKGKKLSKEHKKKLALGMRGKLSRAWKGGKYIKSDGYILVFKPNHPFAQKKGYIPQHRLIVEQHLNRFLTKDEIVHHLNNNRSDNRIENLMVFKTHGWHKVFHNFLNCLNKGITYYSGRPLIFVVENKK